MIIYFIILIIVFNFNFLFLFSGGFFGLIFMCACQQIIFVCVGVHIIIICCFVLYYCFIGFLDRVQMLMNLFMRLKNILFPPVRN